MVGKIKYVVSDRGSSISKALKLSMIPQIHDITHRFGNILKKVYKNDNEFVGFTKKAAGLRVKIQQTKWAYLLPPNQRSQSRFLNIKPIVKWAESMLEYMQEGEQYLPCDFPHEKFDWLPEYQDIIYELNLVLSCIEEISVSIKNHGLQKLKTGKYSKTLKILKDHRTVAIKEEILSYFNECFEVVSNANKILCTSDIIESCFGKYKNNISKNSLCGITDLSLYIPASTCKTGINEIHTIMESITIKDINKWSKSNIGESYLKKRKKILYVNKKGTKSKLLKVAQQLRKLINKKPCFTVLFCKT